MRSFITRLFALVLVFGVVGIFSYTHAEPLVGFCGDGMLDPGEQCDGIANSTCDEYGFDSGTVSCIGCVENTSGCFNAPIIVPAVCGDGVTEGDEICDDGESNGIACTAEYGASCDYCSSSCQTVSVSGGSCGDGNVQEAYEQCEGEMYARRSLFSESMCSSIAYGETCSECNVETCQYQVIEGPKCGDGTIDAVVCAGWFDGENSATPTTGPDFGTIVGNTPRYISNDDECDTDSVVGLEGCAVYDGSSFYSCRGTCSQGVCQTAPQEVSVDIQVRSLGYESVDLATLCFHHKTGLLENGSKQLAGYTYHGNGLGSVGDSEEILDLDVACASITLPSEECDDGSQNGQECKGDGCTYCSSSCSEVVNLNFGGSSSSTSSSSSNKFVTDLNTTDTKTKTAEDDTNTEKSEEETSNEEKNEETPVESEDDKLPSKTEDKKENTEESKCYEDDYITDRFTRLSALPLDEIVIVPAKFQMYFSATFTMALDTLLTKISGMETAERNSRIEKVVCKIETAKAANGTKHQNTGYESGGSPKEYILQYIQDRAILLYAVQ